MPGRLFRAIPALCLVLLACGCATTQRTIELDAQNPSLEVRADGIYLGRDRVEIKEVPGILEEAGIPTDRTIYIGVDEKAMRDLSQARTLMGYLAMRGYSRSVLVTKRHADSWVKENR